MKAAIEPLFGHDALIEVPPLVEVPRASEPDGDRPSLEVLKRDCGAVVTKSAQIIIEVQVFVDVAASSGDRESVNVLPVDRLWHGEVCRPS